MQLSWMPLGQGLPGGCSQVVGQGCSHLKAQLRLRDPLLSSFTWLLWGPKRFTLSFFMWASPHGSWLAQSDWSEKQQECPRQKLLSFYILVLGATCHRICHILFIRSESVIVWVCFVFGNCNHCCFCCGHPCTMLGVSLFISCKNKIQCVCVKKKKWVSKSSLHSKEGDYTRVWIRGGGLIGMTILEATCHR